MNRLVTRNEVLDSTKGENGKKHIPIKVHFIGVGELEIPDGKTILETYEGIRKNPPIVARKEKYGAALTGCTVSCIPRLSFAASGKSRRDFCFAQ